MINTKKVEGRRKIKYSSLDELLRDAEQLAAKQEVQTLGNWSQGQIYEHLARAMNNSIDGFDSTFSAPLRWILSLLMKKKFLYKEIPSGFQVSGPVIPEETATENGLNSLREAVARQKNEPNREMHPGFGTLTNEEWDAFNLRHAELHMSFLA